MTINNLDLELGAGKVDIKDIKVLKETNISGGTGQVNITDSELHNTELEIGVGELNLSGKLLDKTEIDCGIGSTNIELIGTKEDYKLNIEKGIGNITINNKKINNNENYGTGKNKIKISGGIGNINISFNN